MYSLELKGFFSAKNESSRSQAFNHAYATFLRISEKSFGKEIDVVRRTENVIRTIYERGFVDEVVQGNDLLLIAKEVM